VPLRVPVHMSMFCTKKVVVFLVLAICRMVPLSEDRDMPRHKCMVCMFVSRPDDDMPPGSPEVQTSGRTSRVCRDIHL